MLSRFATNISKAREAINTSAKKALRSTQSNKEHVNTKALEKWRKKKEEEKENHPSWTNNPGSEKMAQAGFGGRKRKTRKRRKRKRSKRRRKRSRTRKGGIMDDNEKDEYEDVIEEFGGKERIVPGSDLPNAATKGKWKCTQETEYGDLCGKRNQKYYFKCQDPFCQTLMPCGNYKKPEDRSECKRYHQLLQNKAIYQERQWNKEELAAQQREDSLRDAYNEGQGYDDDEETWSLDDEDIGPLEYGDSLSEKEEKKITKKFLKSSSKDRGKGFLSRMMSKVPKRTIWKRGKSHGGRRKTRRKKNKKKRTKKKARRRRRRSTKRGKGIYTIL